MANATNHANGPPGKQAAPAKAAAGARLSGADAVKAAREQVEELTGRSCESVSGVARTEDGWSVTIDVVELERVPHTTDVLASYVVDVDDRGELVGYRRAARYVRGQLQSTGEGSS
jgi:Gas vesicle synthesis protein GvpO